MKKLVIMAVALTVSLNAFADESRLVGNQKFVVPEGDVYGQLCLAALESRYVLEHRAEELGVSKQTMKDIECNGLSLIRFAKTHRGDIQDWFVAQRD